MPPGNDEWMGTVEAAGYLGIVLRTLYRVIDRDQIPAYKFGRVIRLRRADVDAYVERHRVKPGDLAHLYPDGKVEEAKPAKKAAAKKSGKEEFSQEGPEEAAEALREAVENSRVPDNRRLPWRTEKNRCRP